MSLNIIGISAFYHDAACCILKEGQLIAAAEEERFSRIKGDPSLPRNAFKYCLGEAGLSLTDIDCIAYYEDPIAKLARQLWSGVLGRQKNVLSSVDPNRVQRQIRNILGFDGDIRFVDHHMSHAASCFYFSGFRESAILTMDGVGEWDTTSYGFGNEQGIDLFEKVQFPHSLGILYSTITSYLGFEVNEGEYKVMGLAPYGRPVYCNKIRSLITSGENGQYRLQMKYFDFPFESCMYAKSLSVLLGRHPRKKNDKLDQFHMDVARSLQQVLEDIILEKCDYLHKRTGSENLCLAGGVALNCVANGQIKRKSEFKQLFVQPAASDAGGAVGAAAAAFARLTGSRIPVKRLSHVYLGPSYNKIDVERILRSTSLKYHNHAGQRKQLLKLTAKHIANGKVIGWFQGKMEFGPRSLGCRSILADPRDAGMRDKINNLVKKREAFRPFAPAVIDSKVRFHFDIDHESPFMLETCQVISHLDLPAITHVDNSARVQTVSPSTNKMFYELLVEFEALTGCPILLNTSFNVKGEPIVCSPEDAIKCFIHSDLDYLVLEDYLIARDENDTELLKLIINTDVASTAGIRHDVYTFV
ncbi:MAG TPA: carbamoyltransferase N-terminal domain-containing protein [Puia sp.]|nr:carbamoyltransferase N-terminal domain-containing protein [Puia sp.]